MCSLKVQRKQQMQKENYRHSTNYLMRVFLKILVLWVCLDKVTVLRCRVYTDWQRFYLF